MMTKEMNGNSMTIQSNRGYDYQVAVSENLEGTEPSACVREGQVPGRPKANAQRKRTGPRALQTQITKTGGGGGLARGTWNRPSAHAKIGPSPPRGDSEMQKKRTGPGAPRAGRSEGKSGETRRFGEGLGKLGICRRLTRRK